MQSPTNGFKTIVFDHVNIHLDHGHGLYSYCRDFPLVIVISWQLTRVFSHFSLEYVRKNKTWTFPLFAWKHTKSSSTQTFIYIELTLVGMQLLEPHIQKRKNGA